MFLSRVLGLLRGCLTFTVNHGKCRERREKMQREQNREPAGVYVPQTHRGAVRVEHGAVVRENKGVLDFTANPYSKGDRARKSHVGHRRGVLRLSNAPEVF